jgi:23S rRNA (adenine2503-C2)-methyltransferase
MEQLQSILELDRDALTGWCQECDQAPYRADQIRRWIFGRRAMGYEAMTDVPAALRRRLGDDFAFFTGQVVTHTAAADGTEKLLLQWPDGQRAECVVMREGKRRTACVSTQVGCGMGCVFCASGLDGVARNLRTGEILEQILRLDRLLDPAERLSHVVVMGMGEPLANLAALLPALESIGQKGGLGISPRRVTISTVGLPERIDELAEIGRPYSLAVSLHAPNDTLRNQLVPVNANIGIATIVGAADRYFQRTGRQVTYEYVLLGGINDRAAHADELLALLAGRRAHLNLIPYNHVEGLPYRSPSLERTHQFVSTLRRGGMTVTLRKRKGTRIAAACGQLRRSTLPAPTGTRPVPSETHELV